MLFRSMSARTAMNIDSMLSFRSGCCTRMITPMSLIGCWAFSTVISSSGLNEVASDMVGLIALHGLGGLQVSG